MTRSKQTALATLTLAMLASGSAHAGGLPQMDHHWFGNELLWLAVSFLVLYVAVAKFIAPSIEQVLHTRAHAIDEAIHEAERAKQAAEATRGTAESTGNDARQRASEIMAQAQAKSSAEAAEAFAKLDKELERKAGHAEALVADAVKKAESGIDAAAESLATAMAEQLLTRGAQPAAASGEPKLKLAVKR